MTDKVSDFHIQSACYAFNSVEIGSWPLLPVSSFSHGFFRFTNVAWEDRPSRTVSGICLIPGIGWPVVINSTIWLKDVGYGASDSELFVPTLGLCVVDGKRFVVLSLGCIAPEARPLEPVGLGRVELGFWERQAWYASKSIRILFLLVTERFSPVRNFTEDGRDGVPRKVEASCS